MMKLSRIILLNCKISSVIIILYAIMILYSNVSIAQINQTENISTANWVLSQMDNLEERIQFQVQNVISMINLGAVVIATVVGLLSLGGVVSYRSIMREIRDKLEQRLEKIAKIQDELIRSLDEAQSIYEKMRDLSDVDSEITPSVLLKRAEIAANQRPVDEGVVVSLLAKIASIKNVDVNYLNDAAHLALKIESNSIAKLLFSRAIEESENAPYTAFSNLAVLSAKDQDWQVHQQKLDELLETYKTDPDILHNVADFYFVRGDWGGLETAMAKAQAYAPFSPVPARNRARAAQMLGRPREEIVDHFERALGSPMGSTDSRTLSWYSWYLYNGGLPRSTENSERAEALSRDLLTINPEDGDERVKVAKLASIRGDTEEAVRQLLIAIEFGEDRAMMREANALMWELGQVGESLEASYKEQENSNEDDRNALAN